MVAVGILATCVAVVPALASEPFGITTGDTRGTYFAFGQDMRERAEAAGLALRVLPSEGSLENMYRVFTAPEAQLGIVQQDVLFWIRSREGSAKAQQMADRIKLVFPLYVEEVHVLARDDAGIATLADLTGKIVGVGEAGSGTVVTSGVLFELAGVTPAEEVEVGGSDALAQLKRGALDAMIYVAGAPVKLFAEEVAADDGLRLVPIEDPTIAEFYGAPQALDASNYPWAKDGVRTVAVRAMLVTYDYQSNRQKCAYVGDIANLVRAEIGVVRETGHPKWRDVDLDAELKGWGSSPCTSGSGRQSASRTDPGLKQFLDDMARELQAQ
jgi:hypothetical protein